MSRIVRFFSNSPHSPRLPLNLKGLLHDPEALKQNVRERRVNVDIDRIIRLNTERLELSRKLNEINSKRKQFTSSHDSVDLKSQRSLLANELRETESNLAIQLSLLPNTSSEHSPLTDNLLLKQVDPKGNQCENNNLLFCDHVDLCKKFDLVDFQGPARTSGAHFYALKGVTALLEMALVSWATSRAIDRGFIPIAPPDCIKDQFVVACGFQPRRETTSDTANTARPVYQIITDSNSNINNTHNDESLILAGTSEMFLASQHSNQIIDTSQLKNSLPFKYVATSHCFRSEVGHHSAASRGLYRVHQFTKVELFSLCDQSESSKQFDEICNLQAALLDELGLPYRVLEMARGELGAAAHRKWDHEVWMPGRRIWGEVMSTSNCTDYQSRRLAIRLRDKGKAVNVNDPQTLEFPHTLNGTACAVPRIIMALLETNLHQNILKLPAALEQFYPTRQRVHGCDDQLKIQFV